MPDELEDMLREIAEENAPDAFEADAVAKVGAFFEENPEKVFFSRQVEVMFEDEFFHWVTNRAIRELEKTGKIRSEFRRLKSGSTVKVLWHHRYRYYRRDAAEIVKLVDEYGDPNISAALGLHGELMVLEGFAKCQFLMHGRNANSYNGKQWTESEHNLDFIFERDGRVYGVEVKNMLGYMDYEELKLKIRLCRHLGIKAVFAARMLPKVWIKEIVDSGGFALVLKYQLYPPAHRDIAQRVRTSLKLPVDAPKALADGTMARFVKWHGRKHVN